MYALVVGKAGTKLEKSKFQALECGEEFGPKMISNPACHYLDGDQDRGLHGSVTLAQVVDVLQNWTDRPVFDQTGLSDYYDIHTEGWVPMRTDDPAERCSAGVTLSDRPTIFDVFAKLGLQLESQRSVIDTFVIDHVERPTDN